MDAIVAKYNDSIILPQNTFTKSDHSFIMWNTASDGSGTGYYDTSTVYHLTLKDGDIVTLYAQWKLIEYTITLLDGPWATHITQGYGTVIDVPDDPSKRGYKFKGWYLDGSDEPYVFTTMPREDITLYVRWDPVKYTIRFDGNGATGEMPDIIATYDESYVLPESTFVYDGFKLGSWWVKESGFERYFSPGEIVSNLAGTDGDIIVFRAIWVLEDNVVVKDGVEYTIIVHEDSKKECHVSGYVNGVTDAVIPAKIRSNGGFEYDVVGFEPYAFQDCTTLESVAIPNSITSIVHGVFYGCTELRDVTIPDCVNFIGYNAFSHCISLEHIILPDELQELDNYVFMDCFNLKTINLPDSLTTIGDSVFEGCSDLIQMELGKNAVDLDPSCFTGCMSLKRIIVSEENKNYKSVDGVLFSKDGRSLIKYPAGKIDRTYVVPDGTVLIEYEAFAFCNYLEEITFTGELNKIGNYAFFACVNLKVVHFPETLEGIGVGAFTMCTSLASFNVDDGCINFKVIDGALYEMSATRNVPIKLVSYPAGKTDARYVVPDTVYEIYDEAFAYNSCLESIDLGNIIFSMGNSVFEYCTALKSMTFPESLESIGRGLFYGCTSLETVYVPSKLTDVEVWGFDSCASLKNIVVAEGNTAFKSIDGVLFSKDGRYLIKYPSGRTAETYDVPDGVESVSGLYGSIYLKTVTLPNLNVYVHDFGCEGYITKVYRDALHTEEFEFGDVSDKVYLDRKPRTYTLYFDPTGGVMPEGFAGTIEYVYGSELNLPMPTNEGCIFKGWYYFGISASRVVDFNFIEDGMEFIAMWAPKPVSITFDANEGTLNPDGNKVVYKTDTYGVLPTPTKEGYSFDGWFTSKVGGNLITSSTIVSTHEDHKLYAHWSILRFTVTFEFEGESIEGYPITVDYGAVVNLPTIIPDKESTDDFEFVFDKWVGFSDNFVVKSDVVFSASFIATAIACPEISDDGTIDFVVEDSEEVVFTPEIIEEIKQQIQESESVKVEVSHGSIELDKGSVTKLDGEKKVSMTKVEKDDIPDELPVEAKVRPVFEVSVGDVHDFDGGRLTITFKYQLLEGENADYLQIWHFKDDGTYEVEECVYDNVRKCIVFSTGTLSYFSVMHVEPDPTPNPGPGPNPNPGPTPSPSDDDDEGGSNIVVFIGAGAAAVVVIGLVVFFLIRRKA